MDNIVSRVKDGVLKVHSDDEGMSGGYYDSEGTWHDFGGSGSSLQPILHMNVTCSNDSQDALLMENYFIKNNNMGYSSNEVVAKGETKTYSTLVLGDYDNNVFFFGFTNWADITVTNTVNCTYSSEDSWIIITDPTKEASCDVVASYGGIS